MFFDSLQHRSMCEIEIDEVIPQANSSTYYADFERLYRETNECDPFHDVIYQVCCCSVCLSIEKK